MPIISHDHSLLFVMTPRTACTAIGDLLCRELGGQYLPDNDVLAPTGYFAVQKKHATIGDLLSHQLITEEEVDKLITFACVRNPFDSLASLYVKKREKYVPLLDDRESWIYRVPGYVEDMHYARAHSFDDWLEHRYRPSLFDRLTGRGGKSLYARYTDRVRYVMKFESLAEDFANVLERAGLPTREIPVVNRTTQRDSDYRAYYSPRSRKIVETVFARELQQYGYRF